MTLILLSVVSVCTSEESIYQENIELAYLYTAYVNSNFSINSKTATCKSIITAESSVTKIEITQKLQKISGDEWKTISTWSKTSTLCSAVFTNSKSSLSAGTYRTRTIAKVYKGDDYETVSKNSTNPKLNKISVKVEKGNTIRVKITGKAKKIDNKYTNTKKAKITSKVSAGTITVKGVKKGTTTLKIKVNGVKTLKLKVKVK